MSVKKWLKRNLEDLRIPFQGSTVAPPYTELHIYIDMNDIGNSNRILFNNTGRSVTYSALGDGIFTVNFSSAIDATKAVVQYTMHEGGNNPSTSSSFLHAVSNTSIRIIGYDSSIAWAPYDVANGYLSVKIFS